jgi:hypothetical protein
VPYNNSHLPPHTNGSQKKYRIFIWVDICENNKCVRKVFECDAALARQIGMSATGENVPVSPGQHVLNQHGNGPTPFLSASTRKGGAPNISGTPITIDLDRFKASGGKVIEQAEIVADLETMVANQEISRTRFEQWLRNQPKECEILLKGQVPASAIETGGAKALRCCGKCAMVVGIVVSVRDISIATVESIDNDSPAPLAAEAIRQTGGWAGAWLGAKGGFVAGAALGIESGPGAIATGIVGAMIGGALGYYSADCIADEIYKN